jgi:hypothetical protein
VNCLPSNIDISKIRALIYHFPNGKMLRIDIKDIEQLAVLEFEVGKLCDTSHIDGKLHFYPRGNT